MKLLYILPFLLLAVSVYSTPVQSTAEEQIFSESLAAEFFEGLWDGITTTVSNDLELFHICGQGFFKVFGDFQYTLNTWKESPASFFSSLTDLIGRFAANILPCYIPYSYTLHVKEWLTDMSWSTIATQVIRTVLISPQVFYFGMIDLVGCIGKGNMYCAGENIGKMGYTLILH